ncbi:AAA family ATPase [Sutcliffiella horikoshii]|uniref:AAA family ATPase n=1 Tax=Sutcliffiella horikoshii TaxID=79883 RepID=UPI00384A6670
MHSNFNIYNQIKSKIEELKGIEEDKYSGLTRDNFNEEIEQLKKKIIDFEEKNIEERQNISSQYQEALTSLLNRVYSFLINFNFENMKAEMYNISFFNSDFLRMEILEKIAITKNNIVILGANGAGKSSFVSSLQQSGISNMVVIPAQKSLFYFPDAANQRLYTTSIKDVESYQMKDFISFSRGEFQGYQLRNEYLENFSVLVTALSNNYIENRMKSAEQEDNAIPVDQITFNKLRNIWSTLLPHIDLKVDPTLRTIYPVVNGNRYNINALSDGEKCILFYIGNILMAPSNSFIIVDEPETYLNPSIYNKLWDLLCKYREDCQFIFCSHTVDFITSRINTTLVWNKKFTFPNTWDIEFVPDNTSIPTSVLAELLGSRKKVLFCERNDKNSYDYKIYSSIFLDNYTVIPAGGHTKVIQYVKAFNNLNLLHNNIAVGIIDGDLLSETAIDNYKEENIFILPFNEIEMLLFTEEVMEDYLTGVLGADVAEDRISKFKKKFYERISDNKEKIIIAKIKKEIDYNLENYRIQNTNTISELVEEYNNINALVNIDEEYEKISNEIDTYLGDYCYRELLKICNLKENISKGLANQLLDSNYVDKAIYKISSNSDLNTLLKQSYFNEIMLKSS